MNDRLEEIKALFQELICILNQYGDATILNQKKIIQDILCIIDCDIEYNEKFQELKKGYENLYYNKGSLSEFNIWRENFEERRKLNEPLDKIRKRLWEIFM